jgi:DNA-binding XRE family transcriptional regulator
MSIHTKTLPALSATDCEQNNYVPHAVAQRVLTENCSATRSWREFLGKTTEDVAKKIGIAEAEYIQWESLPKLTRRLLREKVANALDICPEQLEF